MGQQPQPASRTVSSQPSGRRQLASLSSEHSGQRMAWSDQHSATIDRAPNAQRPQQDGATAAAPPRTMAAQEAPARNPSPACALPSASFSSECCERFLLQQEVFSWLLCFNCRDTNPLLYCLSVPLIQFHSVEIGACA